jgi:hypothetical protein
MRSKFICGFLAVCGLQLIAAEKPRDWQIGQVVESKALTDPRDHAIASAEKTYLVKGSIGTTEDALAVGATVRFAVEDKTMFVSLSGKEYKLSVLGVRASVAKPSPPAPVAAAVSPAPVPPPAPKAAPLPAPTPAAVPAPVPKPAAPAPNPALDNDAVVKMIVGGLKEDTVVSVVQSRPVNYILTPDALLGLKAAGVPQSVIAAMTAKMK